MDPISALTLLFITLAKKAVPSVVSRVIAEALVRKKSKPGNVDDKRQ